MKKVLFATTALVATAGIAAADVSLSGKSDFGIASALGADAEVYSEVELDIAFSGATDNGLSFGASMDINVGRGFDLGDDEYDANSGVASLGSIFVSGAFGKITADQGGIDDLYDDDNDGHDLSYGYSAGGVSVALTMDVNDDTNSSISYKIGYSVDGLSASITGNDGSGSDAGAKINASYKIDDAITASLEYKAGDVGDAITKVGLAYAANGLSVKASADSADDWDLGLGATMAGINMNYSTDENSAWEATFSYALGTGATLAGGVNAAESSFVGVRLAF
jgi:outer membrane protein OmpU